MSCAGPLAARNSRSSIKSQRDLVSGARVGVEALVRWQHPVHGKVAPAHFIAVAEETGLIVPLGEWVLRRACSDAVSWTEPLTVAVNLSPAQFRDADMAETVARVLRESASSSRSPRACSSAIPTRYSASGRGCASSGSGSSWTFRHGYSSFNYLARFAFDKIKIDRQFVRNMTRDPAMLAIVKTIRRAWQVAGRDRYRRRRRVGGAGGAAARVRLSGGARLSLRSAGRAGSNGNGEGDADQARNERRLIIGFGPQAAARSRWRRLAVSVRCQRTT